MHQNNKLAYDLFFNMGKAAAWSKVAKPAPKKTLTQEDVANLRAMHSRDPDEYRDKMLTNGVDPGDYGLPVYRPLSKPTDEDRERARLDHHTKNQNLIRENLLGGLDDYFDDTTTDKSFSRNYQGDLDPKLIRYLATLVAKDPSQKDTYIAHYTANPEQAKADLDSIVTNARNQPAQVQAPVQAPALAPAPAPQQPEQIIDDKALGDAVNNLVEGFNRNKKIKQQSRTTAPVVQEPDLVFTDEEAGINTPATPQTAIQPQEPDLVFTDEEAGINTPTAPQNSTPPQKDDLVLTDEDMRSINTPTAPQTAIQPPQKQTIMSKALPKPKTPLTQVPYTNQNANETPFKTTNIMDTINSNITSGNFGPAPTRQAPAPVAPTRPVNRVTRKPAVSRPAAAAPKPTFNRQGFNSMMSDFGYSNPASPKPIPSNITKLLPQSNKPISQVVGPAKPLNEILQNTAPKQ